MATAVALEQRFAVQEEGLEVTGRLDCALETEAGLELIDFKFTSEVPQDPDPLQLQLYSWGLREVSGSTADTLTYYYLRQEHCKFDWYSRICNVSDGTVYCFQHETDVQ